jgi:hypothetical protein
MDEQMKSVHREFFSQSEGDVCSAVRMSHRRAARVVGDYEADRPRNLEVVNLRQVQLRTKASVAQRDDVVAPTPARQPNSSQRMLWNKTSTSPV